MEVCHISDLITGMKWQYIYICGKTDEIYAYLRS